MKDRSTNTARFALNAVALAAACLWSSPLWALGLGRLTVTSALGETLKAEVEVTSMSAEEASSLKLRVAPPEAYRAAGVEYNVVLPSAQVQVVKLPDGRTVLRLTSDRAVLEPFVDVIIEANWTTGRLVREYTLLFDPPTTRFAQSPAPSSAPSITPSPAPAPLTAASPMVSSPPVAAAPTARPTRAATAAAPSRPPVAAAADASSSGDEYRVRAGDTLSRIAGRTQRSGISLDQMLVSLFRGNPQAFVGENMNRLKAGVVLNVPTAEEAAKLSVQEAREIIVAQSADFSAYRQRLASGATPVASEAPARQARGEVQAQVDDRKQAAAPTPDRLKLSQGNAKANAPEARASADAAKKDDRARLAELARNVEELKRLQSAAAPAPVAPPLPSRPPAPAPAPVIAPAPAPVAAAKPTPAPPAPPAPLPAPPAPAVTAAPATPAPTIVAAVPPPPPPQASPPPAPVPAPPPPAVPTPAPKAPSASPAPGEPGMLDSLLDNSLLLPGIGVLVALLVGLGIYRLRGRMRKPAGETSFLESRLQPDSFFGASGGQRIDTRDATSSTSGNSSSMSYSLSQLDAIGDVDPVAEADVYLAYGRDLQAEEILKEAMRSTPERMAIRSKLLEVYAKRRDTKAYELLATQMFNLTNGEGEDWTKAQELGLSIDPDNVLYQPGGAPEAVRGARGQVVEALGASTVPNSGLAGPSTYLPSFQPATDATLDGGGLDLDLDLDAPIAKTVPMPAPSPISFDATQPLSTGVQTRNDDAGPPTEIGEPRTVPVQRTPPKVPDAGLDFDLASIGNETPTVSTRPAAQQNPTLDFGDFGVAGNEPPAAPPAAGDPLARKLELAEEFRQIGDLEGARELLEEVVAKGDSPLRAKAQGMLDKLG